MIVDPMGRVQTELDETEGIAYGEVGGCRSYVPLRFDRKLSPTPQ